MARYDINGKVALVTGGARGIGLATGAALARRGASVVLVDLDPTEVTAAACQLASPQAIGIGADVTDVGAMEQAVALAVERFGGVDLVIANAGLAPRPAPVRLMPADEFERVMRSTCWASTGRCAPGWIR